MLPKLLVIIPTHNEVLSIRLVLDELRAYLGQDADILVVDDYSTDGTPEVLKSLDTIVVTLPINLGYSGALQTGYKYAVTNNYEYIVQFDGDGQHIAEEIGKLVSAFENSSADVIIGSRFAGKGEHRHPFLKRVATFLFCFMIKIISGSTLHDPTSGFQLLNRKVFEHYSQVHNFPYYPDANIIIEMLMNRYRVKEVHVAMRARVFGESMHTGLIQQAKYMIKVFYSIFIVLLKYPHSTLKMSIRD